MKYVCPNCGAINPDIMERTIQNYVIDTPLIINSPTDIDYDYDNIQKGNVGDDGTVEWVCIGNVMETYQHTMMVNLKRG